MSEAFGHFEVLRPYGIARDDITPAIDRLLDADSILIELLSPSGLQEGLDAIVERSKLGAHRWLGSRDSPKNVSNERRPSRTADANMGALLMVDREDPEAVAASYVVRMLLQEQTQVAATLEFNLDDAEFDQLLVGEDSRIVLWLVTLGTLRSPQQLLDISLVYQRARTVLDVMPLIVGESFPFPGPEFYATIARGEGPLAETPLHGLGRARPEHGIQPLLVASALRQVFSNIAVFLNVAYANEEMLRLAVKKLAERVATVSKPGQRSGWREAAGRLDDSLLPAPMVTSQPLERAPENAPAPAPLCLERSERSSEPSEAARQTPNLTIEL